MSPGDPGDSLFAPWVVLKFGGTSVSTLDSWERIAKILRSRLSEGVRPLVVCSALSQVSNRLEEAVSTALAGVEPVEETRALRRTHEDLARQLSIEVPKAVELALAKLEEQLAAIAATREASARLQAEVLGAGETCSTRLAAAWLSAQGLTTRWLDARTLLKADLVEQDDPRRQYLSATCTKAVGDDLRAELGGYPEAVLITQGFVVGSPEGGTSLLGRGGSDTSATYFGERLAADRVEIWTDVEGLFSADPRVVPDATPLRRVGYDEVIELATRGAKVLHPRSLVPARDSGIPIEVRSTREPSSPGTVICDQFRVEEPAGLAISSRRGMTVVTMDVEMSWQQVGLIAELTACFARHGLSIDSIASSLTRVTVSLDPTANLLEASVLEDLMKDLSQHSRPVAISPVASVSIVGTHLRRVIHGMPSLLRELESREVYLLAHAANDHSLTFVVDESESDDLVRALHRDLVQSELGLPAAVAERAPESAPA